MSTSITALQAERQQHTAAISRIDKALAVLGAAQPQPNGTKASNGAGHWTQRASKQRLRSIAAKTWQTRRARSAAAPAPVGATTEEAQ